MSTPTPPVNLTIEETLAILRHACARVGEDFDAQPPPLQTRALTGAMNVVLAMQDLGYVVRRPLRVVPGER